jgi:hypothetical protein
VSTPDRPADAPCGAGCRGGAEQAPRRLNRDAYLPALAGSVNNLAVRLGESGRRVEALAAAQEAVALCRELVELNRDAFLPDLAMSVNKLAIDLAESGWRADGLAAALEAVTLYQELAAAEPDAYDPAATWDATTCAQALVATMTGESL